MIQEITAKSILRKYKKIDSWFLSSHAINLYRGCTHNCVYCDGRNEKYQVEGEFGRDIAIKINAHELLAKDLNPQGKRTPFKHGFMIVCGGVSDSYQDFEKKYELSRKTLELLYKYKHPVHMLTKSTLIERDLDILQKINEQNKALVSFSFSSVDDEMSRLLEPGVPAPSQRLRTISKFKESGFCCGMFLMPVVPFLTDTDEMLERAVFQAKNAGIDFIIFGGMTLKPGRQKDYFMNFLKKNFSEHVSRYEKLYAANLAWGAPEAGYTQQVERKFSNLAATYGIPKRIPAQIFRPLVSQTEFIILILEQLDYLARLKGHNSPYGYAAYTLSKVNHPIESLSAEELLSMKGIGPVTVKIIQELIKSGRSSYYENVL